LHHAARGEAITEGVEQPRDGPDSRRVLGHTATGKGYGHLAIQKGDTASREFLRVTFGDVTEEERQRVRRQLEEYCGQDTEGMIWIVDALRNR